MTRIMSSPCHDDVYGFVLEIPECLWFGYLVMFVLSRYWRSLIIPPYFSPSSTIFFTALVDALTWLVVI